MRERADPRHAFHWRQIEFNPSVLSEPVQARNSRSSSRRSIRIRSWRVPGDQAFAKARNGLMTATEPAGRSVHLPSWRS